MTHPTSPLLGRTAELSVLESLLARCRAGEGAYGAVYGDPGIGKTTLGREFHRRSRTAGFQVLWVPFWGAEESPPLTAWRPLVEDLQGGAEVDGPRRNLLGQMAAAGAGEADPIGLREQMVRLLQAAAAHAPVVVCCDDVHAAGPDDVRLLGQLAQRLRDTPVLLLVLTRPPNLVPERIRAALLDALRGATTVVLQGLDAADVAELLARLTGRPVSHQDATSWRIRSGGNPLFVEELARAGPGGVAGAAGITHLVGQRLEGLPPGDLAALRWAALVGPSCPPDLLGRLAERSGAELAEARARVAATGVLESAGPQWSFHHPVYREYVYQSWPEHERALGHQRVAHFQIQDGAPEPGPVAYHLLAAIDASGHAPDRETARLTALWVDRAARVARARGTYAEAARFFERLLQLFDPDTEARSVLDAKRRLGMLLCYSGLDHPAGVRHLEQALSAAEAMGDAPLVSRLHASLARVYSELPMWADANAATWHFTQALRGLPVDAPPEVRGRHYASLAVQALQSMSVDAGLAAARETAAAGRASGVRSLTVAGEILGAWYELGRGQRDGLAMLREAQAGIDPDTDRVGAFLGLYLLGLGLIGMGRIGDRLRLLPRIGDLGSRGDAPTINALVDQMRIETYVLSGDQEAAEAVAASAGPDTLTWALNLGRGDFQTAVAALGAARERYRATGQVLAEAAATMCLATCMDPAEQPGRAGEVLDELLRLLWDHPHRMVEGWALAETALAAAVAGRPDAASETLARYEAVPGGLQPWPGTVSLARAFLAHGFDSTEAEEQYRRALDQYGRDGAVWHRARAERLWQTARPRAPRPEPRAGRAGRAGILDLGSRADPDVTAPPEPDRLPGSQLLMSRRGSHWILEYGEVRLTLPHRLGLADLATLVARPGADVSALELAARESGPAPGPAPAAQAPEPMAAERARSTVTKRLRAVIAEIGQLEPALGQHLRASVRTGTVCRYRPGAHSSV